MSKVNTIEHISLIKKECLICRNRKKCRIASCCGSDNYICEDCITKQINFNDLKCAFCRQQLPFALVHTTKNVQKIICYWKNIFAMVIFLSTIAVSSITLVLLVYRMDDCKAQPCYCDGDMDECGPRKHPIQPFCGCSENKYDVALFTTAILPITITLFSFLTVRNYDNSYECCYYNNEDKSKTTISDTSLKIIMYISTGWLLSQFIWWSVYYNTPSGASFLTMWFSVAVWTFTATTIVSLLCMYCGTLIKFCLAYEKIPIRQTIVVPVTRTTN